MHTAPWRSPLSRAIHQNRSLPNARYVQLATVRPNGWPANRSLVFRGFVNEPSSPDLLQFVTDRRSEKVSDIEHHPLGEVCWYFPKTREQFRLRGSLTLVPEDASTGSFTDASTDTLRQTGPHFQKIRTHLWRSLSDNTRIQFLWPHPGHERIESDPFHANNPDPNQPTVNFCALLLHPVHVDHLELRGTPQNRWHYHLDETGQWDQIAVNP